jgi:hypothetical protein
MVRAEDWPGFDALEHAGYDKDNIPTVTRENFDRWLATYPQGFIGAFDGDGAMVGYHYGEIVQFTPDMIGGARWQSYVDAGYENRIHDPCGNTLYGLSVVAKPGGGIGSRVFQHALGFAWAYGKEYYAGVTRISGFRDFAAACGHTPGDTNAAETKKLGQYYALQCAHAVGGKLGALMREIEIPSAIPRIGSEDSVITWFIKNGAVLYDVVPYPGAHDPRSLGYGAAIAIDLRTR